MVQKSDSHHSQPPFGFKKTLWILGYLYIDPTSTGDRRSSQQPLLPLRWQFAAQSPNLPCAPGDWRLAPFLCHHQKILHDLPSLKKRAQPEFSCFSEKLDQKSDWFGYDPTGLSHLSGEPCQERQVVVGISDASWSPKGQEHTSATRSLQIRAVRPKVAPLLPLRLQALLPPLLKTPANRRTERLCSPAFVAKSSSARSCSSA